MDMSPTNVGYKFRSPTARKLIDKFQFIEISTQTLGHVWDVLHPPGKEIRRSCCGNCGGYFNVSYTLGLSAQASSEEEPVAVVVAGATGAVSWGRSMISIRAMGALSVMRWPSFTMRV